MNGQVVKLSSQTSLFRYVNSNLDLEGLVLRIAESKGMFTVDDLHVLEPEIAKLHRDKRVLGAVLASLKRKGKIRGLGYVKSKREKCHNRPVMAWRFCTVNEAKT